VCDEHFGFPSRCLLDAFAPDVFVAMGDCTNSAAAAASAVSAAAPVQELKQLSLGSPKDRAQGFITTSGCSGDRREGMLHKLSTGNAHDRAQVVAAAASAAVVASPDNIIATEVMQRPRNNEDLKDRTRRLANGSHILVCNKRPPNSAQSSITNSTQSSHTTTSRSSYNTSTSLRSSNKQARVLLHLCPVCWWLYIRLVNLLYKNLAN
jgi:hypothetical protein